MKESSIQIRSLHGPIKYVQNTAQHHTHRFLLSIRLPSGHSIYLFRLIPELLRGRSMAQWKPPQTAKSLKGIYVFDDGLMDTPLQANHKVSSIQFIYIKQSHLNTLPDPCVFYSICLSLCWRQGLIIQSRLALNSQCLPQPSENCNGRCAPYLAVCDNVEEAKLLRKPMFLQYIENQINSKQKTNSISLPDRKYFMFESHTDSLFEQVSELRKFNIYMKLVFSACVICHWNFLGYG